MSVVRCPNQFFDRLQLGKPKSQGTAKLATQNDLGAKMYLVRHMTFDNKKKTLTHRISHKQSLYLSRAF